jgi:hypothetical protein
MARPEGVVRGDTEQLSCHLVTRNRGRSRIIVRHPHTPWGPREGKRESAPSYAPNKRLQGDAFLRSYLISGRWATARSLSSPLTLTSMSRHRSGCRLSRSSSWVIASTVR